MSELKATTKKLAALATLRKVSGRPGQTIVEFQGHIIGWLFESQSIVRPVKRWFPSANHGRLTRYGFEHRAEAVATILSHYFRTTGSSSSRFNDYMDQIELNDPNDLPEHITDSKPMTRSVNVSTKQFEFSHGRKPRGRGCWMFDLLDDQGRTVATVSHTGTYTEAKKNAVARAKFAGCQDIELGS